MALLNLKTKDTMTLFVVATVFMMLALLPCFGQESGPGTSCWGYFNYFVLHYKKTRFVLIILLVGKT
jgi:hypothetical protein